MNYFFSHILIAFLAALTSTFAFADNGCDKSYALQVEVSGLIGANLCDSSSSSFVDSLKSWERTNLNYTQTSQAYALGRFNDVTVTLNYAANSTTLVYNFPELGHAGSFTGSTRDKSQRKRLAPYDAYPADGWEGSRSPCRRGTVWVPYRGSECVIVSRGADECT